MAHVGFVAGGTDKCFFMGPPSHPTPALPREVFLSIILIRGGRQEERRSRS